LNRPWREDFSKAKETKPVVIVGMIQNKTAEYIESETFIKDIEREFINSGMVRVVQNSVFREKLREERADQGEFASPETQSKWGRELGANFMLFGVITAITDSYKKEKVVSYKVNLELVNLETNEKVWIGDKEIKKYIKN
jgi:PBP1b-binding outer membrane lipoprotein LpoB